MTVRTEANDSNRRSGKWVTQARNRLAARREEKPLTKAGQIRALWQEIEGALAGGESLKSIGEWLEEEGVIVTRATLSSYKKRFRCRGESNRKTAVLEAFVRQPGSTPQTPRPVPEASPRAAGCFLVTAIRLATSRPSRTFGKRLCGELVFSTSGYTIFVRPTPPGLVPAA